MMNAIESIVAERKRQIEGYGWNVEKDDQYTEGQLARAGGIYALVAGANATDYRNAIGGYSMNDYLRTVLDHYWPFDRSWWKPTNRRRDLVKAGALIVAEIERLDRAKARESK
ncbi:hypothetical protein NKJ04_17395 [Mesorhizobium sp. M0618]|uniref:hypothetical protein n=1 Tax=Mesorhizobium sp. M0618 TaxID=2956972 RepID=UPI0033397853